VQSSTGEAVTAIQRITQKVAAVDRIANALAAAVEQQSGATSDIARNVDAAARGTREVSDTIRGIDKAAADTETSAADIQQVSEELIAQSTALKHEVDNFLRFVEAA